MVIYTVLAKKSTKKEKIEKKKKKTLNNFWGPCQVLNRYRHFGHFLTHFAALSVTDTKQMVTIWTSRFEDLSLNCD